MDPEKYTERFKQWVNDTYEPTGYSGVGEWSTRISRRPNGDVTINTFTVPSEWGAKALFEIHSSSRAGGSRHGTVLHTLDEEGSSEANFAVISGSKDFHQYVKTGYLDDDIFSSLKVYKTTLDYNDDDEDPYDIDDGELEYEVEKWAKDIFPESDNEIITNIYR